MICVCTLKSIDIKSAGKVWHNFFYIFYRIPDGLLALFASIFNNFLRDSSAWYLWLSKGIVGLFSLNVLLPNYVNFIVPLATPRCILVLVWNNARLMPRVASKQHSLMLKVVPVWISADFDISALPSQLGSHHVWIYHVSEDRSGLGHEVSVEKLISTHIEYVHTKIMLLTIWLQ